MKERKPRHAKPGDQPHACGSYREMQIQTDSSPGKVHLVSQPHSAGAFRGVSSIFHPDDFLLSVPGTAHQKSLPQALQLSTDTNGPPEISTVSMSPNK